MGYRIYHGDSAADKKLVAIAKSEKGINMAIVAYFKMNGITSYYQRRWKVNDNTTIVDYGSHSDFIYIEEV